MYVQHSTQSCYQTGQTSFSFSCVEILAGSWVRTNGIALFLRKMVQYEVLYNAVVDRNPYVFIYRIEDEHVLPLSIYGNLLGDPRDCIKES